MIINENLKSFEIITKVYHSLNDELSKELYLKRLNYNVSNTQKSLEEFFRVAFGDYYSSDVVWSIDKTYHDEPYRLHQSKSMVIVYGCGLCGNLFYEMANLKKKKNVLFCDKRYDSIKTLLGREVISPQTLIDKYKDSKIVIASFEYFDEICEFLISQGLQKQNIMSTSKEVIRMNALYFDPIIKLTEDEVFVDLGVLDAFTSIEFAKRCNNKYKSIYLMEPDKVSYNLSKENIQKADLKNTEILNIGAWDKKETLKFTHDTSNLGGSCIAENGSLEISVDALDNLLIDKGVTYIKMDIEGAELNALMGAKKIIQKYKPKLAISIYHKPEDIIVIPAYIKELVPEYKLYIRHYTTTMFETVLYAIAE